MVYSWETGQGAAHGLVHAAGNAVQQGFGFAKGFLGHHINTAAVDFVGAVVSCCLTHCPVTSNSIRSIPISEKEEITR